MVLPRPVQCNGRAVAQLRNHLQCLLTLDPVDIDQLRVVALSDQNILLHLLAEILDLGPNGVADFQPVNGLQ